MCMCVEQCNASAIFACAESEVRAEESFQTSHITENIRKHPHNSWVLTVGIFLPGISNFGKIYFLGKKGHTLRVTQGGVG